MVGWPRPRRYTGAMTNESPSDTLFPRRPSAPLPMSSATLPRMLCA